MQYTFDGLITFGNVVLFYDTRISNTYYLSNCYPTALTYKDVTYSCSGSLYESLKFIDNSQIRGKFEDLNHKDAISLSKKHRININKEHFNEKRMVEAMKISLSVKFYPTSNEADNLLETGSQYLLCHSPPRTDGYWGDFGDGTGKNKMGILLMERRKELGGVGVVSPNKFALDSIYRSNLWKQNF